MLITHRDLLDQAKREIHEIDVFQANHLTREGGLALDIREADEVEQGAVTGSLHIPRGFLEFRIEDAVRDKTTPIAVYCAGGARSIFAAKVLQELGYTDVASVAGGFNAWKTAGLPWGVPKTLTSDQKRRYSRHLLIPEVG